MAPAYLVPGGVLIIEHGLTQGLAVREMLAANGYERIKTLADLSGKERVTLGARAEHK